MVLNMVSIYLNIMQWNMFPDKVRDKAGTKKFIN